MGSLRRVLLPLVFSAVAKRPRVSLRHRSKVHEILLFVGFTEHVNRRHHRWGDFRDHATSSRKRHHGEQFAATIGRLAVVLNFFLSFVFYRAVFIPTYRLIFPHPGVICYTVNTYLRCCFGCTPTKRDRTMKYSPRQMRAGREGGLFSVIILLGLTFAVIAPLIAAVCAFFFLTNFIIWSIICCTSTNADTD